MGLGRGHGRSHLGVMNEALPGAGVGRELAGGGLLQALDDRLQADRQHTTNDSNNGFRKSQSLETYRYRALKLESKR